jgi:tRNA A-37 threonylcarbamoyl transferase component Bud32
MRGCISETETLKFLDGRLAADAVAALEEHVDRCDACRQLLAFLAQPFEAAAPLRSTLPREQAVGPTFAADELVAERYRIVRFIAEGGMGEVYEAEDTMLRERMALKTVGAALSDDLELAERLKREVQLARRVTHPNVCRIFDVGVHARPSGERIFFMTMELLAGETLGRRLRRAGRLAPRDALPIIVEVAAALDAAHDAGIIHRDLKAENVFLVSEPRDRAVVMDFGLAEMHASREAREQPLIERETLVAGTPHYMAPEEALGRRVTSAADIYAFGVVVYEMVTGTLPFPAGSTPFSIVAKRLKFEPEPPEVHAPGLPARWSRAILRCLARDPSQRFATGAQVVAALRPARTSRLALGAAGVTIAAGAVLVGRPAASVAPPCPPLGPGAADVWVDGSVERAGSGAKACPFRTIGDASRPSATAPATARSTSRPAGTTRRTASASRSSSAATSRSRAPATRRPSSWARPATPASTTTSAPSTRRSSSATRGR